MLLDPHARIHEVALNALGSSCQPGSMRWLSMLLDPWIMPGSMRWLSMLLDPHASIHEVALNALGSSCQDP